MRAALTGFRSRATLVLALLALGGVALQSVSGSALGAGKTSCRHISLYAEELPNSPQGEIRIGYGLTPSTAKIPGPLIEMTEGQCLRVKLTNDVSAPTLQKLKEKYGGDSELPLAVSIHPHGAKYERTSDGTLSSNSFVMPGQTKTFTWSAPANTAGYWWYHDHVVGTEHGTGGLTSGLWGGLIIRRPGDLRPDAPTFVVAMGDNFTINLERYPDVPSSPGRASGSSSWSSPGGTRLTPSTSTGTPGRTTGPASSTREATPRPPTTRRSPRDPASGSRSSRG